MLNKSGGRNDWWNNGGTIDSSNIHLPNPIDHAAELDALQMWQQKVSSVGITIGA